MATPEQLKKLEKLAKVLDGGDVELLTQIDQIEAKTEKELQAIYTLVSEALAVAKQTRKLKGERGERGKDGIDGKDGKNGLDGHTGRQGERGRDGKDGKDGKNGKDGVDGVDGKDGEMGIIDEATIAYLEEEVKKAQADTDSFNRAIGIVDQRTSFLINKASNLEKNKITGVGVNTITVSDTTPTNPQAGDLWIDTDAYTYRAVTSTYTITANDYLLDCSGTFTITLPTAVGFTGEYIIKNTGVGIITVSGGETIDGETTQTLYEDETLVVRSTGTNWIII
jgi:hypothetical protein